MASLAETNPYLKDPTLRNKMIAEDALQSSIFEGARGLTLPPGYGDEDKRRSTAARKKADKAA